MRRSAGLFVESPNVAERDLNQITICGTLTAKEEVRYTPAGLIVFEGTFHHRAEVAEAGRSRTLEFDFPTVSFGPVAEMLHKVPLGTPLTLKGFLAPRSKRTQRLIVHITEYI